MTILLGAAGTGSALPAERAHALVQNMARRAALAPIPLPSLPAVTTLAAEGVVFGVCERHGPAEAVSATTARQGPLWIALQGQLDNRDELAARWPGPATDAAAAAGGQGATLADAALVLAAYQRLGVGCVEHFMGDWAFALWDAERQCLVLARDATGNTALFWWQGAGQLLFASSLPALLAAGPVPARPDPRWFAGLLTVFTDPACPGATAFEEVHAVPPGHLLMVQKGHTELKRWWRPEALPALPDEPLPELQARFVALYQGVVGQCLRRRGGAVAATLSSGLDSGSVVALAAPLLAQQGQRLAAYVHTPRFRGAGQQAHRTEDEWPLALATAQFVGNVDPLACPTEQCSPVEGIRRWLDVTAAPSFAPSNWYWLLDIVQRAASSGASVLLTGQAGNSTVSYAGTGDLRPLLRRGGAAAVLRELQAEDGGLLRAVRERLLKPVARPAWYACRCAFKAAARGRAPGWQSMALLHPGFADSLGLAAAMSRAGHDPSFCAPSPQRQQQFRLSLLGGADNGLALWSELGAAHGMTIRDPTRDRRIVELCWRLPDEIFWANGRRRGLIRRGLHDRLPREVLYSSRKGLQSSDIQLRLRDCRDDLLGQVDAVCRHPVAREWIDTGRLVASAHAALDGAGPLPAGCVSTASMLRTLAAGMFLARHA